MESSLNLSYQILSIAFVNLTHELKKITVQNTMFIIMITTAILLQFNQFLYVLLQDNSMIASIRLTLRNSVYHIGVLKILSFVIWKSKWQKVFNFVVATESCQESCEIKFIVNQYTKRGRHVMLFVWIWSIINLIFVYGKTWYDYFRGREVSEFHMYWPKYDDKDLGYLNVLSQTTYGILASLYAMCWDTTFVLLMTFFAGQLKLVRNRLRHALDCEDESQQKRNLISILSHYRNLRKYSKLCNSITSPILFVHLLFVSGNLAVILRQAALNIITSRSKIIATFCYIAGILTELYLAYWHANEVTYHSTMVSYGIYESKWTGKNKTIWKLIQPVIMATSLPFKFSAGPYNTVTLGTMLSILRISYSFYTLISQTS